MQLDHKDLCVYSVNVIQFWNEPLPKNPTFCIYAKTKTQISLTAKLISAFVFATWIVQYLFFLNTKFQASSHLQQLYSLVCVRPGQNPSCWFSYAGAQIILKLSKIRETFIHVRRKGTSIRKWASLWENRSSGFPTRSGPNRAVQPQKKARGL